MKITFTLKTPDIVDETLNDEYGPDTELKSEMYAKLAKWFEYGEYLTVEYDTDTETLTVKERK